MVTNTKLTTWKLQENTGSISITDYGCSTSSANNFTAFNTAMAAAIAAGVTLYIPEGVFLSSEITLTAGIKIDGVGTLKLAVFTAANSVLIASNNCMIKNITLDGNSAAAPPGNFHCLNILNTNVFIDSVTLINSKGDALLITGTPTDIEIDNVTVINNGGNGITVTGGIGIDINNFQCISPNNAASPGIGISLTSTGNPIKNVSITNALIRNAKNNGIDVAGFGSRNVSNLCISGGTRVLDNTGNGIRITNAEEVLITAITVGTNTGDGIRIEGDAQQCRVLTCIANTNTGRGVSEVTTGATPNNNGYIYNVQVGNTGGNVTNLVGTSSFKLGS